MINMHTRICSAFSEYNTEQFTPAKVGDELVSLGVSTLLKRKSLFRGQYRRRQLSILPCLIFFLFCRFLSHLLES